MTIAVPASKAIPRKGVSSGDATYEFTIIDYFGDYFHAREEIDDGPLGYLGDISTPGSTIRAHFHPVDQFQVVVSKSWTIGKHMVEPVGVHYTDAFTPYGPIVGGEEGIVMFVLRHHRDARTHYMPGARDKMERRAGRALTAHSGLREGSAQPLPTRPVFDSLLPEQPDALAAFAIRIGADDAVSGPDPVGTGGQYYVVVNGSLLYDGEQLGRRSMVHVAPTDEPLQLRSGPDGAELLVVQFGEHSAPTRALDG